MQLKHTEHAPKKIKGAIVAIKCLEHEGVKVLFAYPGGASMEFHQALCKSKIEVILPRHEQGGAFAAGGYARSTGKVGVCMATSGPGATNLISGIADAYMDSVPLVVLTGQIPKALIGKTAFQETDMIGMTRPIVKHSYLVMDAYDLPTIIKEAFYVASTGRPGPVVIDVPKDVQQQLIEMPPYPESVSMRGYKPNPKATEKEIEMIREAISECSKPCLYVGGGIIRGNAAEELTKFAIKYNIPVTTTLMGIGSFPENHPISLKWLGMHGTVYANNAANESDLLLAFGARFDDRVTGPLPTFAAHAKIIHVDIDRSEINKNKRANIGIVSDIKYVLQKLNQNPIYKDYADWFRQINEWKAKYPLKYEKNSSQLLPQEVIEAVYNVTKGNAIIVPCVGQHQMWSAQYFTYTKPRQLITSGGLGCMGFGFPTSIGAKVANPDSTVICISGDGSMQMNIQELGTAHAYEIGVKIIVMNNQHLGMVAQWEDRFYGSQRGNTVLVNERAQRPYPDFVTIAKGYMIPGKEVYTKDELYEALKEMLATPGPYLLDVHIEYQEHVLPMIPPGKSYKDIIIK
ncbi:MAG TPA: biosynthetic-type acetolactate synthase large subunit [Lentisphaeria bacterium]|nr:MAG: acetolactate synthase, large subunit, biosynthetic type [Lentisphaerae bacterium GWF2_38_69]HBM16204.1 biosynthetic-type acetolactate synthase large subunit [Lentisphaeria bacterium]